MSRNAWVVLLIVLFCALIAVAVLASFLVRSPNEAAIRNSHQLPIVTAKVEKRTFTRPVESMDGQISTGSVQEIKIPAGNNTAVVTHTDVNPGDTVRSGSLLGRVSGRPVILLQLPFTLYRDINVGDSGDDVRAVQQALSALGLYRGIINGSYTPPTSQAVELLYKRVRAIPPPKTPVSADTSQPTSSTVAKRTVPGEKNATSPGVAETPPAPTFTPMLKSEVVTLSTTSATVEKISGTGTVLGGDQPFATLKIGAPTVSFRATVSQVPKLPVGTRLEVKDSTDSATQGIAIVMAVGDFNTSSDLGSIPGRDVVASLEGDISGLTDGMKVSLKTTGGAKATVDSLCVPVTALRQKSGGTYVVLAKNHRQTPVRVAETIDGYALLAGRVPPLGTKVIVSVSS